MQNIFKKTEGLLVIIVGLIICSLIFVTASQIIDNSQGAFDNGTYYNTYYNTTLGAVTLSGTGVAFPNGQAETPINMTGNVLLYHMDESSGNIIDSSGNGNNGAVSGAVTYGLDAKMGSSIGISDGTSYIVAGSNPFSGVGSGTISMWIKPSENLGMTAQGLLDTDPCGWNALRIYGSGSGGLDFELGGNGQSVVSISDWTNQWHLVTLSFGGGTISLYLDGTLAGQTSGNPSLQSFTFGSYNTCDTHSFNGQMDELAIWNRILSSQEIQTIYNSQSGNYGYYESKIISTSSSHFNNISWNSLSPVSKLPDNQVSNSVFDMTGNVALYHMDESGGNIIDTSNNGNHGSVSGNMIYGQTGVVGNAIQFDGTGYFTIPQINSIFEDNPRTVSMWVNAGPSCDWNSNGNAGNCVVYSASTGNWHENFQVYFGWYGTNVIYLQHQYEDSKSAVIPNLFDQKWHQLSITYDNTQSLISIYWDGVDVTDYGFGNHASFSGTPSNIYLGSNQGISSNSGIDFIGSMDEFAIWNRALSAGEVAKLYALGGAGANLNLSVRSCARSDCSDSNFTNLGVVNSPQDLVNISNNSYFQYKYEFTTLNPNSAHQLFNVTLDYSLLKIGFVSPTSDTASAFARDWIYANVSVISTNEKNVTFDLYNSSGLVNETSELSLREVNWTNLQEGTYYYNVTLFENDDSSYSTETRMIILDSTAPNVTLLVPENNTISNTSSNNFSANLIDNLGIKNATLNINGTKISVYDALGSEGTGGVITHSNGYTVHTFTSDGTFVPPKGVANFTVTVFGAGGAGGTPGGWGYGALGGAGGAASGTITNLTNSYLVLVGAGGQIN
ncbi:MAG: LamG domain-containing protein, partial [archaeon]